MFSIHCCGCVTNRQNIYTTRSNSLIRTFTMYTLFRNHTGYNKEQTRIPIKKKTFEKAALTDLLQRNRVEKPAFSNKTDAKRCKDSPCKPLHRRDSYSTLSTVGEIEANGSLVVSSSSYHCESGIIPQEICFYQEQKQEPMPISMPLIRKAKFVPDPMNVGDFYGDDATVVDMPGWPKPEARASLTTRKSPRQLLDEMDSSVSNRKRDGRPVLRREMSTGLKSLMPPIRPGTSSSPFARLEI